MNTILKQETQILPNGTITLSQVKEMRSLYLENQYKTINKELNYKGAIATVDNNHVTFNLEDLKLYIKKVEQFADKNNLEDLGLRVYLAAKKDEENLSKTTLFFAPVSNSKTKPEVFFDDSNNTNRSLYYNRGDAGNNGDGFK